MFELNLSGSLRCSRSWECGFKKRHPLSSLYTSDIIAFPSVGRDMIWPFLSAQIENRSSNLEIRADLSMVYTHARLVSWRRSHSSSRWAILQGLAKKILRSTSTLPRIGSRCLLSSCFKDSLWPSSVATKSPTFDIQNNLTMSVMWMFLWPMVEWGVFRRS